MKKVVLYIGLILALSLEAQEDSFYQLQYREKVLHYNQDIKAADYQVSMRTEMAQSARADFLPKLSPTMPMYIIEYPTCQPLSNTNSPRKPTENRGPGSFGN